MEKLWGGTVSVQIIAQLNLFEKTLKTFKCEPCTITEILEKIDTNKTVNTGWRVLINDNPVTDFNTKTNDGDTVYIKLVPEGDNQEAGVGMKIGGGLLVAIGVLVSFASWGFAAPLGAALIGSGIGLFTGGIALYNLDIPNMDREEPKQDPSIRGSRNQRRPYGYVPVLLGTRRIYADLAMSHYTWVDSAGDQYLYQLLCCGQRNIEIEKNSFKIGETLLKDYSASKNIDNILAGTDDLISMEICHGELPKTITKCVHEEQLNAVLKNKTEDGQDASVIRTTPANTSEINVDVFFYNGLGKYNDKGKIETTSVELGIWYKKADEDDSQYSLLGYFNGSSNTISGNELKTKRYVVSKSGLEPANWTVKISRITADSENNKVVDAVYVGSIRSIKNEKPVREEIAKDLTLIALKIKASEKLSNYVEELNFIAQSKMPVYTNNGSGSSSWTFAKTSNPASAILFALQGNMSQQKLADSEIDFPALEKLYKWCEQHQYECNAYISDSMPISQLLSAIGSTCRAEILRLNGKITVNQDIAKNTAVQLFTPRNSHGYSESLSLADLPDAISLKYPDKDTGYAENELNVYNTSDGNKDKEPEIIQNVSLWGVTNSIQARKLGMYKYAVSKNRPLIHKFSVDFEYMLCSKGDRIRYAGDIALAGITQGRIVNVIKDSSSDVIGVETDELIPMQENQSYALRIRLSSGESVLEKVLTSESSKTVFFENPISNTEIEEGNLFAFGTVGNESLDLIVTDIQCGNDLSADITAVDYAPEIFEVDNPNFVLPEYEPKITDVPSVMDSANLAINEWQTWSTYYDGLDKPDRPTGDGNTNGWHRIPTAKSMWISSKTAKDIYSGEWDSPIPTNQQLFDQLVSGENVDSMAPEMPSQLECLAQKDGIQLNWVVSASGLKNDIQKYVIEKTVNGIVEYYETSSSSWFYTFNRNIDGYPEKEDLNQWQFRIKAVNIYDKESDWSEYFKINTSDYLTWQVPPVTVESFVADKNELRFAWNCNTDLTYGSVRFDYNIYYGESLVKSKTNIIATNDTYTFDRDIDGFPETTSILLNLANAGIQTNDRDISKYHLELQAYTKESSNTKEHAFEDVDISNYSTWVPPAIADIDVFAERDLLKITAHITPDYTDYGNPYTYLYEIKKGENTEWETYPFGSTSFNYYFDREKDGFPEKADLQKWKIRAKAVSVAGKQSVLWGGTSKGVSPNTDNYGTWELSIPDVSVRVVDRTITLTMEQGSLVSGVRYGDIKYEIQIQRPEHDQEFEWFKPATTKDPYKDEDNYKNGKGVVEVSSVHIQTMPLASENSDGEKGLSNTTYNFKIVAKNEINRSDEIIVSATALCTNIQDIVKANATMKNIYIETLSAITANLGKISQGSLTGNDNNYWYLSRLIENGVVHEQGSFRVGGEDEYLLVTPQEINGKLKYNVDFKVGNFEISSVESTVNGEFVVISDSKSLDRTRITPTGTYYEHRATVNSEWKAVAQMRTDGTRTQGITSEHSLTVTNMSVADRRKRRADIGIPYLSDKSEIYHFDTDFFNQDGNSTITINSKGETVLKDQYDNTSVIDFTPAILAVAPYSEVGKCLYGQYSINKDIGTTNKYTVDFWIQWIHAENQVLFDIGGYNDRVRLVIQNAEEYYNTPLENEVHYNNESAQTGAGVIPYNSISASSSYIQHYGSELITFSADTTKTLDTENIKFENNTWYHIAVVLTSSTIDVYIDDKKISYTRFGTTTESCNIVINELQNSFILDEFMIDNTQNESFEKFKQR